MKGWAVVRGGIVGGVVAALLLASAGRILGITLPPWNWSSKLVDNYGAALEWLRTAGILLPVGIVVGLLIALICAVVFEYLTGRAGWWRGGLIGVVAGVFGASIVGLVPWFASWYAFAYMPSVAPLGTADPALALAALACAGVVIGIVVGGSYGQPRHARGIRRAVTWREIYTTPESRR